MELRHTNKGCLTERSVDPEVIYSRGSIACPSTLQGTFLVNGYRYRIDGWHTVKEDGRLLVSLKAYPVRKSTSSSKAENVGYIEEVPVAHGESPRIADREHPVSMQGKLAISGYDYDLTGRSFITREAGISIEFLLFCRGKAE